MEVFGSVTSDPEVGLNKTTPVSVGQVPSIIEGEKCLLL